MTSLGDYDELNVNSYTILRKGEAVGSFYGLVFDGVVQADEDISKLPTQNGSRPKVGQEKFRDINGDGKVNEFDRVILGHSHPDINYGLSSRHPRQLDGRESQQHLSGSYRRTSIQLYRQPLRRGRQLFQAENPDSGL